MKPGSKKETIIKYILKETGYARWYLMDLVGKAAKKHSITETEVILRVQKHIESLKEMGYSLPLKENKMLREHPYNKND